MVGVPEIQGINEGLLGIVALALIIVSKVVGAMVDELKDRFDKRRGNGVAGALREIKEYMSSVDDTLDDIREAADKSPPFPACYYDSDHFDRIRVTQEDVRFLREAEEEKRRSIDRGMFSCKLTDAQIRKLDTL